MEIRPVLRREHDADGKVDHVLLRSAAAAEMHGDKADVLRFHRGDVAVARSLDRAHDRGLRQQRRVVYGGGVAALRADHGRELIERRAALDGLFQPRAGFLFRFGETAADEDVRAEHEAQLAQIRHIRAAQDGDRFLDLQRVADGEAERLIHIGHDSGHVAPGVLADAHHLPRELKGGFLRFHERAGAGLYVQHDGARAGGELLGHDARNDQRDGVHRRGHVAQRVHFLIRRGEIRRLPGNHKTNVLGIFEEFFGRHGGGKAGEGFELVDRAAGVPETAAGHFRHFAAARRHHRAEHERGLVADAAGRMLVGGVLAERREIDHVAGVLHFYGELRRFLRRHAAEIDRHHQRGHLVIRDIPRRVAVDDKMQFLLRESLTLFFLFNEIGHMHDATPLWKDFTIFCARKQGFPRQEKNDGTGNFSVDNSECKCYYRQADSMREWWNW